MNEKPKLGTIDSALVSCVSMLSALTELRVEDLAGWLDLYYQIRYLWEVAQGHVTDRQLIRKEDLLPILDTAVREALRGTARKAAETVQEKKKRKPAAKDQDRSLSPSGSSPSQEEPGAAEDAKTEKAAGTETAPKPGPWTLYKRKVFDRLQQARKDGYTIAQIVEASGGTLSDGKVIGAINAKPLRAEEWKALENALTAVMLLQIPAEKGVVKLSQTTATIVAVVISSGVSLLISILTIISQNKKQQVEMDKKILVLETKMDLMKEDIKSHNQYAKLFQDNIPAIKQHMVDSDRRLDNIERRLA